MKMMIELEEALELVLSRIQLVETERISITEAYQRVLAEDVISKIAMPPFARSPLDGYAYRAEAFDPQPLQLNVVSEIPAGTFSEREITKGEAAKIFTGAPIPSGANCVVRMEDTKQVGEEVTIFHPLLPGSNIVPKGEEIQEGDLLLKQGFYLTPPAIGLLAAVGQGQVTVYRRPRVGLLSTGTELIDLGQPLRPAKIYNSNSYTLRGMLQEAGCEVLIIPSVADQIEETIEVLKLFEDTDVVISTGGASVGDYDLMRHALAQLGCEMLFWKLNLKPGTPVSVGQKGKQLFFSLSGNPAAAMVTFELLVRPVLRKLAGRTTVEEGKFLVKMASGFGKSGRQRRFLRARAVFKNGEIGADLASAQGSGILRSMIGSHLLVDVPSNHGSVEPGELLMASWIVNWESELVSLKHNNEAEVIKAAGGELRQSLPSQKDKNSQIPVISIVGGKSHSGKTTLLEKLIREAKRRGWRVATLKHDVHGFEMDQPGKDTWRHTQAGADVVAISSPHKIAVLENVLGEQSLDEVIARIQGVDVIFTEGYKSGNKPKIEVFRSAVHQELFSKPEELLAIASDITFEKGIPCFGLDDARGICDLIEEKFGVKGKLV